MTKRFRMSDSPTAPITTSPVAWYGTSQLSSPASMLNVLELQLASLPPTEDPAILSVYWNLYLSYLSLKSICDTVQSVNVDADERARKCIVVVGNLPESTATRPSDRIADDRKATTELLDSADIESGFITTQRLGQKGDRPRLMKVFFNDMESAGKVLSKLAKFKRDNRACKLSFRHSLTREERDNRRKLNERCQDERNKAKQEGRDDDYVVYADDVVLRKDIGLVPRRSINRMLTGANRVPLGTRASSVTCPPAQFAWLQAAQTAANSASSNTTIPPVTPTSTNGSN